MLDSRKATVMNDEIKEACDRYGLTLQDVLSRGGRASKYVAKVETGTGATAVLKHGIAQRPGELAALRAWNNTGCSAKLLEDYGDNLFLIEWISGPPLNKALLDGFSDFKSLGRMLRALHAVAVPNGLEALSIEPGAISTWSHLEPDLITKGEEATDRLLKDARELPATLHSDLALINVIITNSGPRVIDPAGLRGPASMDLAQLAVMTWGRSGRRFLDELAVGYGSEPAGLSDAVLFFVLLYLSLAGPDSPLGRRMQELVAEADKDPAELVAALRRN